MRLLYASEHRLERTPDGRHWSEESFVTAVGRYLGEDTDVTALVRVGHVQVPTSGRSPVPRTVDVVELPAYRGLRGTLRHAWTVRRRALRSARSADRVVVRVPGVVGHRVCRAARKVDRRVLAEVVGDPAAVFSRGASSHPARRLLAVVAAHQLRWVAQHADITCYVTAHHLQDEYPPRPSAPTFAISNIILAPDDVMESARRWAAKAEITVVSVASMEQVYKRVDWTIKVAELVAAEGLSVRLVVIGDGAHRADYESLAAASPIDCVFVGHVTRDEVLRHLDAADVYVSTSAVEGVPRAVLEAMARGLPTFAFDVGGTAELVPGVRLHGVGDVDGMAADVARTMGSSDRFGAASAEALITASRYTTVALRERTARMRSLLLAGPTSTNGDRRR